MPTPASSRYEKMKRFLIAILLILFTQSSFSQKINVDSLLNAEKKELHKIPRQMATFQAGFNTGNDVSVAFELDYQYYPLKYMGFGIGAELDDNYGDEPLIGSHDDTEYDADRIVKANFHPMLSFRTPTIWFSHDSSWGMMLRCDPGLVFSVPANDKIYITESVTPSEFVEPIAHNVTIHNHGGKWFFWRVRTGLSFYNEFGMITIGWSTSNYNINYCRNNMVYKGERLYGHGSFSHTNSLFIALSYCF